VRRPDWLVPVLFVLAVIVGIVLVVHAVNASYAERDRYVDQCVKSGQVVVPAGDGSVYCVPRANAPSQQ
jgi:hypothetical protein